MKYRPGKTARKMYRHKAKYGVAGMTKRQLRALAREMDIGVNPRRRTFRKVWPGDRVLLGKRRKGHGRRNPDGHAPDFTRQFRDGGRIEIWRDGEVVLYDSLDRDMDDFFIKPYEVARLIADVKDSRLAAWHHYTKDMIRDDYELQGRGGKRSNPKRTGRRLLKGSRAFRSLDRGTRGHGRRRRNPKRDGTPTRGELRRVKYTAHLEALVQRGRDLETKLKLIKKAPIGSSTPHYYEEQAPLKAEIRAAAVAEGYTGRAAAVSQSMRAAAAAKAAARSAPAAPAAVVREERAEISAAMRELNEALGYLQLQLQAIDPEAPDDEREQIMDQIAQIAKQKKKLREAAPEMATATNPPRRRRYRLTGLRQYTQACRAYCRTAKRCCSNSRSNPRRYRL